MPQTFGIGACPASSHCPSPTAPPATLAATAADWADFSAWCGARGVASLPAAPVTVAGYLAALDNTLAGATLRRRVAGIGTAEAPPKLASW